MINIINKEQCCGCYACKNICPKKCIEMKNDEEGFWYPKIDKKNCIECNLCDKVCPMKNELVKIDNNIIAYACKNKIEKTRLESSSGGVFSLLCKYVVENGGIVFGAEFDEYFNVKHGYSKDMQGCNKFKGSKYVQSKIGESYKIVKEFLEAGKLVLFSGTQCQVKGLNLFLNRKYDNLITVDVICHGVPSPKIFNSYKIILIDKYKGNIKDIRFRDKSRGWRNFSYVTKFDNNNIYSDKVINSSYMLGFLRNIYLRPSCYKCKSKNYTSGSDISLADYWGVERIHPEFDDDKGISLVLVNTIIGKEVFNKLIINIDFIETDLEFAVNNNPCIISPTSYNKRREDFFRLIKKYDLESCINKCVSPSLLQRINFKIHDTIDTFK